MKNIAVIQARLGSTRLPYKMLLSLHGYPIIEWVIRRTQTAKLLDGIVVAIPDNEENNILAKYSKKLGVEVFRGSEDNVLDRFYQATKNTSATNIIRICADNPLIDGKEIDNLIEFFMKNDCDYAYNHIPKGNLYPDGLGAEIISFELLKELNSKVVSQSHKEHCFSYINDNSEKYKILTFDPPDKRLHFPNLKFDVDRIDDYQKLAIQDFKMNVSPFELVNIFLR